MATLLALVPEDGIALIRDGGGEGGDLFAIAAPFRFEDRQRLPWSAYDAALDRHGYREVEEGPFDSWGDMVTRIKALMVANHPGPVPSSADLIARLRRIRPDLLGNSATPTPLDPHRQISEAGWGRLDEWLTLMATTRRRFGPGCGYAEFEVNDWREQVRWRMRQGERPNLTREFLAWLTTPQDP